MTRFQDGSKPGPPDRSAPPDRRQPASKRGGRRPGAGRKPHHDSGVPHLRRPSLSEGHPVHVTTRLLDIPGLHGGDGYRAIRDALTAGSDRFGMRVVAFSLRGDHLHLVCEAADQQALSRGLQGLLIRIARGINRSLGRKGHVFGDRYHEQVLRTPSQVHAALAYVLEQGRRQVERQGAPRSPARAVPGSSARPFHGLVDQDPGGPPLEEVPLPEPESWLLRFGWRRSAPSQPES